MILAKRRFAQRKSIFDQIINLPPSQFYDSKHPPLRVRLRTLAITLLATAWLLIAWLFAMAYNGLQLTGLTIAGLVMVVCLAISAAAATVANGIAGELLPRPVAVA